MLRLAQCILISGVMLSILTCGSITGRRDDSRLIVLNQPVVVSSIRIPNYIIEHHDPLKLQLELLGHASRQRLSLKPPQPVVSVPVTIHKQLKRTDLKHEKKKKLR